MIIDVCFYASTSSTLKFLNISSVNSPSTSTPFVIIVVIAALLSDTTRIGENHAIRHGLRERHRLAPVVKHGWFHT